jgi:hypothetical protein
MTVSGPRGENIHAVWRDFHSELDEVRGRRAAGLSE